MKLALKIMVVLFVFVSCKQNKITETPLAPDLFVSMSKTPCYGQCPVYSFELFSDGTIDFTGKRFVKFEGHYKGQITDEQIHLIKEQIKSTNFFELESKYDSKATDIPTCIIQVIIEEQNKTITDRMGAPKELKELEKMIEEMVLNSKMEKVEE